MVGLFCCLVALEDCPVVEEEDHLVAVGVLFELGFYTCMCKERAASSWGRITKMIEWGSTPHKFVCVLFCKVYSWMSPCIDIIDLFFQIATENHGGAIRVYYWLWAKVKVDSSTILPWWLAGEKARLKLLRFTDLLISDCWNSCRVVIHSESPSAATLFSKETTAHTRLTILSTRTSIIVYTA